ncbi:UNVERIFIED_CONTAM: hypothetical protein DES50_11277 [Williamsia faeni]
MTTSTTTATDSWTDSWQAWHVERITAATSTHGLASVTGTHWLGEEPLEIDSVPGTWTTRDGKAVNANSDGTEITLAPGETYVIDRLRLTTLGRDGQIAIRVFDPQAPTRAGLAGIDAFEPDPAWVITGVVESVGNDLPFEHVDGFVAAKNTVQLRITVDGSERTVTAIAAPDGSAQIVFADSTNGNETQRFRFLNVEVGDVGDIVTIDFNRAFLPPCTFTDHFLCPLPPAENRFDFPVRAGESKLVQH